MPVSLIIAVHLLNIRGLDSDAGAGDLILFVHLLRLQKNVSLKIR